MGVAGGQGTVRPASPPALPALVTRLRRPVWRRSQERMRERFGFDLSAPDALEHSRDLALASPDDPDLQLLHASALSAGGDDAGAMAAVERALMLDSQSARAHTSMATMLVHGGDIDAAMRHARAAADLAPDDPQVLYNLGIVCALRGDTAAADAALKRAAALLHVNPSRWRFWR